MVVSLLVKRYVMSYKKPCVFVQFNLNLPSDCLVQGNHFIGNRLACSEEVIKPGIYIRDNKINHGYTTIYQIIIGLSFNWSDVNGDISKLRSAW